MVRGEDQCSQWHYSLRWSVSSAPERKMAFGGWSICMYRWPTSTEVSTAIAPSTTPDHSSSLSSSASAPLLQSSLLGVMPEVPQMVVTNPVRSNLYSSHTTIPAQTPVANPKQTQQPQNPSLPSLRFDPTWNITSSGTMLSTTVHTGVIRVWGLDCSLSPPGRGRRIRWDWLDLGE